MLRVTLKVVQAEIPVGCFCVKYHTAWPPEPHRGRPYQAAGPLLTPPLEKTNSLTVKHLLSSCFPTVLLLPSAFMPLLSLSCHLLTHFYSRFFPVAVSCFHPSAHSHKAVFALMFSRVTLHPLCNSQVRGHVRETTSRAATSDWTLSFSITLHSTSAYLTTVHIVL